MACKTNQKLIIQLNQSNEIVAENIFLLKKEQSKKRFQNYKGQ